MSVPLGGYESVNYYQYLVTTTERLWVPYDQATWVCYWELTNDLTLARQIAMTWLVCGWSTRIIDLTIPPLPPATQTEVEPFVIRYNNLSTIPESGVNVYRYQSPPAMPPADDMGMPEFYAWLRTFAGVPGPQGPQGPQGNQGSQGSQGAQTATPVST